MHYTRWASYDKKWLYYQFSLPHFYISSPKGWENVLFELRSERVSHQWVTYPSQKSSAAFGFHSSLQRLISASWHLRVIHCSPAGDLNKSALLTLTLCTFIWFVFQAPEPPMNRYGSRCNGSGNPGTVIVSPTDHMKHEYMGEEDVDYQEVDSPEVKVDGLVADALWLVVFLQPLNVKQGVSYCNQWGNVTCLLTTLVDKSLFITAFWWLSGRASASCAEGSGFESRLDQYS